MAKTIFLDKAPLDSPILVFIDKNGDIHSEKLNILTTIGRSERDADVRVDSPIVSRVHGEIALVDTDYYYRDMDSTNGTYVNDVLLGANSPDGKKSVKLKDSDKISFNVRENTESHKDSVTAIFLQHGCENVVWNKIKLDNKIAEICIGRSDDVGLKIDNLMISEKHASFFSSVNGWAIIDHNSTNGVYLNSKKMSIPRYLEKNDVVRIVDTYFIFTQDYLYYSQGQENAPKDKTPSYEQKKAEEVTSSQVVEKKIQQDSFAKAHEKVFAPEVIKQNSGDELVINIVERSVVQRFKKLLLLQDINLTVSSGEMVLILGGSGAGKTTFINAVMGYEKANGKITYKDTDIYEEYERMKYEIGFVPQQDLIRSSDTVYDTLLNAAQMKLPKSLGDDQLESRINEVLETLGLKREKDKLVSKLSGGQKKRLSIAVEFIADPSLFFLDEPDSGVDDVMGRGLMETLRAISDRGKIVMVITHSPERARDLFDKVIVLAKSTQNNCGHLAFYGTVEEAFEFFNVESFREIVKKINRTDENGEGLSDFYIDKYADYSRGVYNE